MRGSIRQRSKGTWQIRYEAPPDSNGYRKQVSETVRGTRKEAERVLREQLTQVESGGFVSTSNETVALFLDKWLHTYAATNTSLRTQAGYQANIRSYIKPAIGNVKLQSLQPQHIQALYAGMLDRGLSGRTVHHVHVLLKEALSHAVKWGLLVRNPSEATTPPRPEKKELEMWPVETLVSFLQTTESSKYGDIYHLCVLTGMRRSELLGLTWNAIDFEACQIMVVKTLQRIDGHGLVEGQPKTEKSRRTVALSLETITLLRRVKRKQIEQRLAAGQAWTDSKFVFTQPDGKPIDSNRVTRDFQKLVRANGLPHLTLKGLRHAHATLLLSKGVHPKIVSERLGHSNISTTMDIYSHVIPGMQERAAQAIDEVLGSASLSG